MNELREEGTITNVFVGTEDHGFLTVSVEIQGDAWGQSFGGLAFENEAMLRDFVTDLCDTFNVPFPASLKGKRCAALYCFVRDNIEGLEAPSGRRFVITEWRRKHQPNTPSPLRMRQLQIQQDITHHRQQLAKAEDRLRRVVTEYHPVKSV